MVGDLVVLRPGDKVPVDGEVVDGADQHRRGAGHGRERCRSTKRPGDAVDRRLDQPQRQRRFRATKVGADTTLAQIVELVQQAQNSKAPGQRLADRAAQYLVILAVGAGLLTFLLWYFVGRRRARHGADLRHLGRRDRLPRRAGLATPTAVAVGTGIGARHNILIKDAATLESVVAASRPSCSTRPAR